MTDAASVVLDFQDAAAMLDEASGPLSVFGPVPADGNLADSARLYRRLARLVHPDVAPDPHRARRLFVRLGDLYAKYTALATGALTVTSRQGTVTVGPLLSRGDITNVYAAKYLHTSGDSRAHTVDSREAVWKVARHPQHNDLLEVEAHALRQIATHGDPRFLAYTPTLLDTFTHRQADTGVHRRTTVLERLDGFVSLAQLMVAFPHGIDPRDAAWMWRRLLVAIGHAHRAGIVHGAVLPEHVLTEPEQHGLVLIDWCYSVDTATTSGTPLAALVATRRSLYPPEVFDKHPATPVTDIYMASRAMGLLMGPRAPRPMQAFIAGCTGRNPAGRAQDAWALLGELDELLAGLYGPRSFRPFHVPADVPRTGQPASTTTTRAAGDPGTHDQQED